MVTIKRFVKKWKAGAKNESTKTPKKLVNKISKALNAIADHVEKSDEYLEGILKAKSLPWNDAGGATSNIGPDWGSKPTAIGPKILKALRSGKRLDKGKGKAHKLRTRPGPDDYQFSIQGQERKSAYWDLMKDGINQSGLALWLSCRHQFYLQYVCGYNFDVYNESIEFGNIFHWLIERWLKTKRKQTGEEWLRILIKDYHSDWMEGNKKILTARNKQTQEVLYALAAAMFPAYQKHYIADQSRKYAILEKEFEVKYPLATMGIISCPMFGTIDAAYNVKAGHRFDNGLVAKRAGIVLSDTKTTSRINEIEIAGALHLNFQLLCYATAYRIETGVCPAYLEQNVIRRTASRPHKGESLPGYARRIGREIVKQPKYFFVRVTVPLKESDLINFDRWILNPIMQDLTNWASGYGPHYPNLNNLIGKYGPCRLFTPIVTNDFAGVPRKRISTRGVEREIKA